MVIFYNYLGDFDLLALIKKSKQSLKFSTEKKNNKPV